MSFFPEGVASARPKSLTVLTSPRCDLCRYCDTAVTPKQPARGAGAVMVVGEFPDTTADMIGKPISGPGASLLSAVLSKHGLTTKDVVFMNALACRPDTKKGEKDLGQAAAHCRPTVWAAIKKYAPQVIIPMGDLAVKSVLSPYWSKGSMTAARWAGYRIPVPALGAWVCPVGSPHYAAARAVGSEDRRRTAVPAIHFERHLRHALNVMEYDAGDHRPTATDPAAGLVLAGEAKAVEFLSQIDRGIVAFDFETTGLKPDRAGHKIVCCSVCWNGNETYSFMWTPAVADAMVTMLQDRRVGKIASNLKFETRWCLSRLKTRVANWRWDTMQAAHVMDARKETTSIKFLAFVYLGVGLYDAAVQPYLESGRGGANGLNRIDELDRRPLLTYCGMDSRLEYLVAVRQAADLGLNLEDWK